MADPIFDPDKCNVPSIDRLPRDPFILDCKIPAAPDPINECAETTPPEPQLPPIAATTLAGGGGGGGGGGGTQDPCVTGVAALCTGIDLAFPVISNPRPIGNLYFRRDSSLRVWGIPSACDPENKIDALVDIGGGPPNSVFWQPPDGSPPRWTPGPTIGTYIKVGGWIRSVNASGTEWGFSARLASSQHWLMPPVRPEPGACLIADGVNGSFVGLAWSYPGVNVIVDVRGADGGTLTFRVIRGIVVSVEGDGEELGTLPGNNNPGGTLFEVSDFNPCGGQNVS